MLIVDNLSPFTPDIMESLDMLDISFACKKFSEVSVTDLCPVKRVILSGRRKNSKEINIVNSNIVRHCYRSGKPLLGICYGAEIVALTFGGSIRKMSDRIQGTTVISVSAQNPLTGSKKSFSVYESHGYCVARLPKHFSSLASSQNCEHEIFARGNIFGTQFHPEKSGSDGLSLLRNFAKT